MNKTPVLVIDSNFLGFQAHYLMGDLTYKDHGTGVIFGFLSRVLFIAKMFNSNKIVFCWDSKFSRRKEMMADYKAGRRKDLTKEEKKKLQVTFEQFKELKNVILPSIGFRNIHQQKYYESDDLIAGLVKNVRKDFIIVSADADLYQLIRSNVHMYNPTKRTILTYKKFIREKGILPEQWPWIKAIAGCKSDNVKGIKGIGEKTAIAFLRQELKANSKKAKDINEQEQNMLKINSPIVYLPLKGTKEIELRKDKLSFKAFRKICRKYKMISFLKGEYRQTWKDLLQ